MHSNKNDKPKEDLAHIERQISSLAPQIKDDSFRLNPLKKFAELKQAITQKTNEIEAMRASQFEIQKNIDKFTDASEPSTLSSKPRDKNLDNPSIKLLMERDALLLKIASLEKEIAELEKEKASLNSDPKNKEYMILFMKKDLMTRTPTKPSKPESAPTVTPTNPTTQPLNLSQNLTQAFKAHPILLTRLTEAHKFELVKSEDESKTKLFSKAHQHNLEVSTNSVTSDPITKEKQKDIVPAMMFIFVQSIAGKALTNFTITADTPQLKAFMENALALQLKTLPEKLTAAKINGIPITDILARSNPKPQKENIENTATQTTLRP